MKKIVSTFLLLFAVCGASAQLHVDLRVGASASMLSEQHLKLGLRGGVNIGYLFDEHFGLRTGLCYVMKGATTSSDVFDYASDRATRLSYIDLPVEATVGFRLSPTSRFDLHAGPYLSRLLRPRFHERLRTRSATGTRASVSGSISSSDTSSSAPKCNTACCELPPPAMNTISAIRSPSAIVSETGNSNTRGAFSDSKTPLA